jgi:hypothetical protein
MITVGVGVALPVAVRRQGARLNRAEEAIRVRSAG